MSPIESTLAVGALTYGGLVARDKQPDITHAVGLGGIAVGLSILEGMSPKLSSAFGTLIVVAVAIVHFPAIAKATGLAEGKK